MDADQPSFTDVEYGNRRRVSRREVFLDTMQATIPWDVWVGLIEPYYYYASGPGKKGRKAKPILTGTCPMPPHSWGALTTRS